MDRMTPPTPEENEQELVDMREAESLTGRCRAVKVAAEDLRRVVSEEVKRLVKPEWCWILLVWWLSWCAVLAATELGWLG